MLSRALNVALLFCYDELYMLRYVTYVTGLTAIEPLQDVYMESTEDGKGVLISWSVLNEELYDNFTVLYCVGAQNVRHQCNVCSRLLIMILLTQCVHRFAF